MFRKNKFLLFEHIYYVDFFNSNISHTLFGLLYLQYYTVKLRLYFRNLINEYPHVNLVTSAQHAYLKRNTIAGCDYTT